VNWTSSSSTAGPAKPLSTSDCSPSGKCRAGVLNLASLGQAVEIRVVVQRHTVPVLAGLTAFIVRNLPFVVQVALYLQRDRLTCRWIDMR